VCVFLKNNDIFLNKSKFHLTKTFEVKKLERFPDHKAFIIISVTLSLTSRRGRKSMDLLEPGQVPAKTLFFGVSRKFLASESKNLFNSKLLTKTVVKLGQKSKLSSLKTAVERFD